MNMTKNLFYKIILWSLFTGVSLNSTMAFAGPKIQTWQTQNGAKVLFVQAPEIPMLDIQVMFDAGSARDGKDWGLASMTSTLLGTATQQHSETALSKKINTLGVQLGSNAGRDSASISMRTLTRPSVMKPALSLFKEILGQSIFTQKIYQREMKHLKVALQQQQLKPQALESKALWQHLYPNHPYGHSPDGNLSTLPLITLDQVKRFYHQYYVANNAQIAMVGAISRQQAEQIANQLSNAMPKGQKPPKLPRPAPLTQAYQETIHFDSTQTYYALGQVGIARGDADYAALFVGNHLLGGSGFGSLLMSEVREKRGLVYSVYSYFEPMKVAGPFVIGLSTKNATALESDKVVKQTLKKFMQNFSDKKLQAIKDNLLNGFAMRMDSNAKMLGYISMIGFYHQRLDYLDWFPKQIAKVTKQQILTAWQHHIHPNKMVTIMVGQPK